MERFSNLLSCTFKTSSTHYKLAESAKKAPEHRNKMFQKLLQNALLKKAERIYLCTNYMAKYGSRNKKKNVCHEQ